MKILITGGAGFIGSHIVDSLLKQGHKLYVLDLWESDDIKAHSNNPNFNFYKGNILDVNLLNDLISNKDMVIHMASVLGTSETITTYDVELVAEINVLGTIRLLKLAKKHKVSRVIIPTTPDVTWLNPYKITKAAIEKFSQLFSKNFNLEVVCLKLGNIYGPRERFLDSNSKAPFNYQKIIPTIIMETLKGNKFDIYGSGDQRSEYIYINDVVEIFNRALSSKKNLSGLVINVGKGKNLSVNEIVNSIEKVWKKKINCNYIKMRPGEHHVEISLEPTSLKKYLDYKLKWNLDIGLIETIKYYENLFLKK